jgi:hypothetical protein
VCGERGPGCQRMHVDCEACEWMYPRHAAYHAEVEFLLRGRPSRLARQPPDDEDAEEG